MKRECPQSLSQQVRPVWINGQLMLHRWYWFKGTGSGLGDVWDCWRLCSKASETQRQSRLSTWMRSLCRDCGKIESTGPIAVKQLPTASLGIQVCPFFQFFKADLEIWPLVLSWTRKKTTCWPPCLYDLLFLCLFHPVIGEALKAIEKWGPEVLEMED